MYSSAYEEQAIKIIDELIRVSKYSNREEAFRAREQMKEIALRIISYDHHIAMLSLSKKEGNI